MGKLVLLLVAAAIVGGTALTFSVRTLAGATSRGRSEGQASMLARQIAESAQGLVLAAVTGEEGFVPMSAPSVRPYEGGEFTAATTALSANGREITVTVEGRYGGAAHTIETTYAFDPMTFPGPVWLDVPYVTAQADGAARIAGGPDNLPVRFDVRRFDETSLGTYLSRTGMTTALQTAVTTARSTLSVPAASAWAPTGPLLEDLSRTDDVGSAEDLFQVALAATSSADQTFAGAQTVGGAQTWGGRGRITHVRGDLTVSGSGRLTGEGALLVEGALAVLPGGRMQWSGLVVVRAERQVLPVTLDGTVAVTGALVVVQEAAPTGGHMDLTVMRHPSGMGSPVGQRPGPTWPVASPVDFTWYEHTHRFDTEPASAPRGPAIHFAENGPGRHEAETRFWATLAELGSTPIRLEFANRARHGYARFELNVRGQDPLAGQVRTGFGPLAEGANAYRTRPFPASDLRRLVVDVKSLRSLQDRFDGQGSCSWSLWPMCVGERWDRAGGLTVRLRNAASNAVVYDAAMYWHMNEAERAEHQAAEAAWAASVLAGSFGTRLRLGPGARVSYSAAQIARLADKLGFDGNQVHVVSTTSRHSTAAEMRAAAGGLPTTPPPASNLVPEPAPVCSPPGQLVTVCRKPPPGETSWNDYEMRCDQVAAFIRQYPGSVYGTCSDNNL